MKKTCLSMQETQEMQVQSLGWEDLLGEEMALPTPIFLPRESHGQRSLTGYSPRGLKESDMTEHACTHTHTDGNSHVTGSLGQGCHGAEIAIWELLATAFRTTK